MAKSDGRATWRKRLVEERDRLRGVRTALLEGFAGDSGEPSVEELAAANHPADAGTEMFEREKDLSILEQVDARLSQVERALHRLDEGTYGTCEICGQPIAAERLEALPAATFCVRDQARTERAASVR
jgi:RNA polymerase-binding transcription factor DksA